MALRILQIARSLDQSGGGIYRAAYHLAREFRRRGVPVTNRTLFPPAPALAGEDLGAFVSSPVLARLAERVPGKYARLFVEIPLFDLAASLSAARAREAVVLVHGDSFVGDVFRGPSCHREAVAAKTRLGERRWLLYPLHHFWLLREWAQFRLQPSVLVAVSRASAAEHAKHYGLPPERIVHLPNGVDGERFHPSSDRAALRHELQLPRDAFLAVFVGNDFINKGLAQAVDGLARSPEHVHLVVVGRDDQRPCRDRARALGVDRRLRFVGLREDVERWYAAADCLLLLSNYEAFGNVVVEALSAGLPAVVTRVGGITDHVRDGENGIFVEREGASVGDALTRLAGDDDLCERLGAAARPSVAAYRWDRIAGEYLELCESVGRRKGL